jgi:hypothetical protein
MILRGTELKKQPFFPKMALIRIFHLSTLALTYGLALSFFPTISLELRTHAYFDETYLGGIGASVALSVIAPFFRPSMRLYVIFLLRCYILIILGYSIGSILSSKLILGIGLMVEIGILLDFHLASCHSLVPPSASGLQLTSEL